MLETLKIIMALLNVAFGMFALLQPTTIARLSSYTPDNARGRVEIRVITGGLFIGAGIGAILFGSIVDNSSDVAYQVLGLASLGSAGARLLGLVMENPAEVIDRSYWFYLASELVPGIILTIPN